MSIFFSPTVQVERLATDFDRLINDWSKVEQVSPDLKIIVSDMQALLRDMRRWLEQVELSLRSLRAPRAAQGRIVLYRKT